MRFRPAAAVSLVVLATIGALTGAKPAEPPPAPPPAYGDSSWATAPLWDDGKAEFSTYTGTTLRYGQLRPTTARFLLVKEDMVRATLVKSDSGPIPGKTVEVLKQIFIADFPTGTYSYHQMASLFFDRTTLGLYKETMSHTESCGMTFVSIAFGAGGLTHEANSYWDGEAARRTMITWPQPARPGVLWDGLPVWLRSLPRGDEKGVTAVWLLPTQISSHSPVANTQPVAATIRMGAGETVRVPAGEIATIRYTVESAAGRDTFWIAAAAPHTLVRMATAAGRRLELASTRRLDYWKHSSNGDERLIE